MASVLVVKKASVSIKALYAIDQAVGRRCPSQRDDVALVQFFLRATREDDNTYTVPKADLFRPMESSARKP